MPIDFVANITGDPDAFLSVNCVMYRGASPFAPDQPGASAPFLISPTATAVRYRTGSRMFGKGNAKADGASYEIRAYKIATPRTAGDETFEAVWSGYQGGAARTCVLPATGGPNVMVTPKLDGCTLTWRSNPDGSASFGHYNLKGGPNTLAADDMRTQAEALEGAEGLGGVSKEHYYSFAKRVADGAPGKRTIANAFALRAGGGGWSVWAQYIEVKGAVYQIRAVERIEPGRWYNLERY
jgi:hypothetical protein